MTDYRATIINTYKYLLSVRNELITHSINIAMNGEMKEIDDAFEEGDIYQFDMDQFRGTKDVNLEKIGEFYDQLENLMNSLANINAIKEEDLTDEVE